MAEEVKQIMPWEEDYQLKPIQAETPPPGIMERTGNYVGGIVDQVKKGKMPWELDWKEKVPTPRPSSKTAPEGSWGPSEGMFDKVFSKLIGQESGGVHAKGGILLTSSTGAEGITQVMPKTGVNPGFGVVPVQDKSKEEYVRFGRDYLRAMLKEFDGDYPKALAAYNAGHGSVKRAVAKSEESGGDWMDHLPKRSETVPYVRNILKGVK